MTDGPGKVLLPHRVRRNALLYGLCVLLACGALALGLLVQQQPGGLVGRAQSLVGVEAEVAAAVSAAREDRSGADLHAAVLQAATREVLAFVNVDHQDLDASTDAVLEGATGDFRTQYRKTLSSLRKLMRRNESVMTGEILSAGVVAANQDSATVLVATKGTVRNVSTDGQETARNLRLQLELAWVDGAWLTRDLQFVG